MRSPESIFNLRIMTFIEGRYTLLPWCRRYDNMGKSEIVSNIPKNDESYLIKDLKNK